MGENTKIEWCDHTFNPWRGCTKVADGCEHCYAATMAKRNPSVLGRWGDQGTRVLSSDAMWRGPLRWNNWARIAIETWNRSAEDVGGEHNLLAQGFIKPERPRVFCASLADVFEDWPGQVSVKISDKSHFSKGMSEPITLNDVRLRLFGLIDATPHLDWLLLTKRPENIRRMWACGSCEATGKCVRRKNVWLGVSVATQEDADRNIPLLLKCRDLSPVLFVSAEPLLGPVDVRRWTSVGLQCSACEWSGCEDSRNVQKPFSGESSDYEFTCPECDGPCGHTPMDECIDCLIAGGESGPKARPMHPDWARSLRDQCQVAGVPFFFKQWGEWGAVMHPLGGAADQAINAPIDGPFGHCRYGEWHGEGRFILGCLCDAGHGTLAMVGKKHAGRILDGREWNEFPRVEGGDA